MSICIGHLSYLITNLNYRLTYRMVIGIVGYPIWVVVKLPEEFKPLWNGGDSIVKRHALSYLYKRGIDDSDILKYNIGYCDEGLYSNRIIIPSYDSDGQLNFFVGRDFYNSKLKYRNSPTSKDIIGFDLFINGMNR